MGKCASYFTAQTNVNADSGPVAFRKATQVLLLLPLVCDPHSDPLPLRRKLVLWFPFILTGSYRGTQKDLEFLLGNNRVRQVYMKFFLFPTSFVTSTLFFFLQKIGIREKDTKTRICSPIKTHVYIKDHNYTKIGINSPQKNT